MGDFDDSEYTEDSPYLILSGKKPGNYESDSFSKNLIFR